MARRPPIRLALDQNFPTPNLRAIADYIVDVELIPIREIDARLSTLEDRQLLIALEQLLALACTQTTPSPFPVPCPASRMNGVGIFRTAAFI